MKKIVIYYIRHFLLFQRNVQLKLLINLKMGNIIFEKFVSCQKINKLQTKFYIYMTICFCRIQLTGKQFFFLNFVSVKHIQI